MPRYFFHVLDGVTQLDSEGMELADRTAARHEAVRACGEMIRDMGETIREGEPFQVLVTDQPRANSKMLFRVTVLAEGERGLVGKRRRHSSQQSGSTNAFSGQVSVVGSSGP